MKTFEDEAFDELAKKQGMWGGGFQAKRAAAMDKLHWSDCAVHNEPAYPAGPCDCGVAQEPVATIDSLEQEIYENTREFVSFNVMEWLLNRLSTTPPKREWEEWNALDEAAARIGEIKGFGRATQDSFAIYIKGLKK